MDKTKVVIADDEQLVLDSTERIVLSIPNYSVVGKCLNGEEALKTIIETKPDLLITDVRMPGTNGLWLLKQLQESNIFITVIIVSAYDDKEYLKAAIKSPLVFDYINKPFLKQSFIETVEAAACYNRKNIDRINSQLVDINEITSLILRGDYNEAKEYISKSFISYKDDINILKKNILAIIADIYSGLYAQMDNSQALVDLLNALNKIHASHTYDEIMNTINEFLELRSESKTGEQNITALVSSCLQMMNSQLSNSELSLGSIAEQLGVTPNYLSTRFSRDVKQNFSNYLNNMRIHAAKDYLSDVHLKVYEVALKSGFSDVGHFNRLFKEHTGMTPLQYRDKVAKIQLNEIKRQ